MTISVLIADDQPLMRAALRMYLAAEPDLDVVAEAADGHEAVALAERLRPDVVVMDIRMPTMDGVEATRRLTAAVPATRSRSSSSPHSNSTTTLSRPCVQGPVGFCSRTPRRKSWYAVRVVAAGDALLAPRSPSGSWTGMPIASHRPARLPPSRFAAPDQPGASGACSGGPRLLPRRSRDLHLAESASRPT